MFFFGPILSAFSPHHNKTAALSTCVSLQIFVASAPEVNPLLEVCGRPDRQRRQGAEFPKPAPCSCLALAPLLLLACCQSARPSVVCTTRCAPQPVYNCVQPVFPPPLLPRPDFDDLKHHFASCGLWGGMFDVYPIVSNPTFPQSLPRV